MYKSQKLSGLFISMFEKNKLLWYVVLILCLALFLFFLHKGLVLLQVACLALLLFIPSLRCYCSFSPCVVRSCLVLLFSPYIVTFTLRWYYLFPPCIAHSRFIIVHFRLALLLLALVVVAHLGLLAQYCYCLPWVVVVRLMLLLLTLGCCYSPCVAFACLVLMLLVEVPTSPSLMLLLASYLTLLLFPLCCFCLGCYTFAAPLFPCANQLGALGTQGQIKRKEVGFIYFLI